MVKDFIEKLPVIRGDKPQNLFLPVNQNLVTYNIYNIYDRQHTRLIEQKERLNQQLVKYLHIHQGHTQTHYSILIIRVTGRCL